jgi:hypothetical protein
MITEKVIALTLTKLPPFGWSTLNRGGIKRIDKPQNIHDAKTSIKVNLPRRNRRLGRMGPIRMGGYYKWSWTVEKLRKTTVESLPGQGGV